MTAPTPWIVTLSPVRTDTPWRYAVDGDTLLAWPARAPWAATEAPPDGAAAFDLAPLPESALLPAAALGASGAAPPWLLSPIERRAGALHLTVALGHGADAPAAARFPSPVAVTAPGPVPLPPGGHPTPAPAPNEDLTP